MPTPEINCEHAGKVEYIGHTYEGSSLYGVECLFPVPVWLIDTLKGDDKKRIVQSQRCHHCPGRKPRKEE